MGWSVVVVVILVVVEALKVVDVMAVVPFSARNTDKK